MSYNVKDIRDFNVTHSVLQTQEIQDAFNLAASNKEAIWFPPGLEFISGPLTLPSNLVLLGAGVDSLLTFQRDQFGPDQNAFYVDGKTNITIRGLRCKTQGIADGTDRLTLTDQTVVARWVLFVGVCKDITIEDCWISYFWNTSIMGSNGPGETVHRLNVRRCHFYDIARAGLQTGQNLDSQYVDNHIYRCGQSSGDWAIYSSRKCINQIITGTQIFDCIGGIKVAHEDWPGGVISGNTFRAGPSTLKEALVLERSSVEIVIEGNMIYSDKAAVKLEEAAFIKFRGNLIDQTGADAAEWTGGIRLSGGGDGIEITGNTLRRSTSTAGAGDGFLITGSGYGTIHLEGNTFLRYQNAVRAWEPGVGYELLCAVGNYIEGCQIGFTAINTGYNILCHNTFKDLTLGWAFVVGEQQDPTLVGTLIEHNHSLDAQGNAYTLALYKGGVHRIRHNRMGLWVDDVVNTVFELEANSPRDPASGGWHTISNEATPNVAGITQARLDYTSPTTLTGTSDIPNRSSDDLVLWNYSGNVTLQHGTGPGEFNLTGGIDLEAAAWHVVRFRWDGTGWMLTTSASTYPAVSSAGNTYIPGGVNFGIGTATPDYLVEITNGNEVQFHVSEDAPTGTVITGTHHTDDASGCLTLISDEPYNVDNRGAQIGFAGKYRASTKNAMFARVTGRKANKANTNTAGELLFETRIHGGAMTEALRLDSSQNAVFAGSVSPGKGVLFPNMTTQERDALSAVAGLTVFNTDAAKLETYDGTTWQALW